MILHKCDYCNTETITIRYDEEKNIAENEIANIHYDIQNNIKYKLKNKICDLCRKERKNNFKFYEKFYKNTIIQFFLHIYFYSILNTDKIAYLNLFFHFLRAFLFF